MAAGTNIMDRVHKAYNVRPDAATLNTTVATANVIGATTLTCAATAAAVNTAGTVVLIGSGETLELAVVASVAVETITFVDALTKVHAVGSKVRAGIAYDMGAPIAGGIRAMFAGTTTDIPVATQRLPLTTLNGYITAEATLSLPYFSAKALVLATGAPVASLVGNGAVATPWNFATDGSDFGSVGDQCFVGVGIKLDGTYFRVELWGAVADYSGISTSLSRGAASSVPIKFKATAGTLLADAVAGFTVATGLLDTKASVFDYLLEAGTLAAGALTTTTTGSVAAGASVIPLTAVTGLAIGSILEIDTGDNIEHVMVQSIASLNVTLKTPLYRAHASGITVTSRTATRFAAIGDAGVTLSISGSQDQINAADFRFPVAYRNGTANITLAVPVLGLTQEVLVQALGMPSTAIGVDRRPLLNDTIGTQSVSGAYFKGALQNGDVVWVFVSGCRIEIASVEAVLNNTGNGDPVTMTFRPSTNFRIFAGTGI